MKKAIWITAIIAMCLGILLYYIFNKQNEEKIVKKNTIQITDFNIEDRMVLKTETDISIGNSIKELGNNFYDIKITNIKDGIEIYLNKLWYETYGDDYIQDEYLAKICRELSSKLNMSNVTDQFEYLLYKYIKDNYVSVRQNKTIEEIKTDKLSLRLQLTEDNIVKLIIRSIE